MPPDFRPQLPPRPRRPQNRRSDAGSLTPTLSAGALARWWDVSTRTVGKWVDGRLLPGVRLPGGRDRRIAREAADAFAREHGLRRLCPLTLVWLGGANPVAAGLAAARPWEVAYAGHLLDVGRLLAVCPGTEAVVLDGHAAGVYEARDAAAWVRRAYPHVRIGYLAPDDARFDGGVDTPLFDAWVRRTAGPDAAIAALRDGLCRT